MDPRTIAQMPENTSLSVEDVEGLVQVLIAATDPTQQHTVVERKRKLLEGIAQLVGADVFIWSASLPDTETHGDVMSSCLIEGGWASEEQRIQVYKALSNPQFAHVVQQPIVAAAQGMHYVTMHRRDIADDAWWLQFGEIWRRTGLDHFLMNIYPISLNSYSATAFHRQSGKPVFSERERMIVHLVFKHLEWYHQRALQDPSQGKLLQLAPRERQTLMLLLSGQTKREIAENLGITEHTVGDYTKSIYKRFAVNSRGELQAVFQMGKSSA